MLPPAGTQPRIRNIKLVSVSDNAALAVIVTDAGVVRDAVIRVSEELDQDALYSVSRTLTGELAGKTLSEAVERMPELIRSMQSAGVHVIEVRSYDVSVFSYCRSNGYLLQIPEVWKDLDQGMKPVPCQWDFAVDYGFFYRRDADAHVGEFIRFAETWLIAHPDILNPITAGGL